MVACPATDATTGLRCVQEEGHVGLHAAPTGKVDEMQWWGTITIPPDIIERMMRNAQVEAES